MSLMFFSLFSGDPGIFQTVQKIKKVIDFALHDPSQRVRLRAESIVRNVPEANKQLQAEALFRFVVGHYHYVNDPIGIEYLKSPEIVDAEIHTQGTFVGDCDDATAYLAALLKSIGIPVRIVVIQPKNTPGLEFRHVFPSAFFANEWHTMDPTAKGKPDDWEAPSNRRYAYDA